jgi:hypothetical protein
MEKMQILQVTTARVIYESPDGGHTIYKRDAGSTEREIHYIDPSLAQTNKDKVYLESLKEIVELAQTNYTIKDQLDRLMTLYYLVRNEIDNR